MKIKLLLALLLFSVCVYAQERVSIRGRIVDEKGEAVEYVQVGIPRRGIGTVSSLDGHFGIEVPADDTLEFHHVSYQTGFFPVTGAGEDAVVILKEAELPPAVFIGGDTKEKYLLRPGTRVPGASGAFHYPGGVVKGAELGSVAKARKPFLIQDIRFAIEANYIPGCVAAIHIYRIEGEPETFVDILHRPIYVDIPVSDTRRDFDIRPEESILLEPGRYFISFDLIDCDMDAVRQLLETPESERSPQAMHIYFPMYFKGSYQRFSALGELRHFPVNIGVSVKGLEYQ